MTDADAAARLLREAASALEQNDDDMLTIGQAAKVLNRPVDTLRYWRYKGYGPQSYKSGRRVMYRRGVLKAWLKEQEALAESA